MRLKFKALDPEARLPTQANPGDAGWDLYAIDDGTINREYDYIEYRTGLACELPENHVGLIFPRSSISNYSLTLCNAVGVLDAPYRGEIRFRFKYTGEGSRRYRKTDKVGQLILLPIPEVTPVWADDLSTTTRGTGGYGSSGT